VFAQNKTVVAPQTVEPPTGLAGDGGERRCDHGENERVTHTKCHRAELSRIGWRYAVPTVVTGCSACCSGSFASGAMQYLGLPGLGAGGGVAVATSRILFATRSFPQSSGLPSPRVVG
jgi:hypothetical protein